MKALILKDLYVADKQMRLLIILALVFCAVPIEGSLSSLGNTYAMMVALMLPLTTVAYDERCRWDKFAAMLPYQPATIVWSKYILSFLGTLTGAVIILAGTAIRAAVSGAAPAWGEALGTTGMLLVIMVFLTDLGLPLGYRFGSEKGRIVMFVALVAAIGAGVGLTVALSSAIFVIASVPPWVLVLGLVALVVGLTALSVRLSLRFYLKRRNGEYSV